MKSKNLTEKTQTPGREKKKVAPLTCFGVSLRPLNPKQRLFVTELFNNGFQKREAAKAAGYEKPSVRASQLLKNPQISRIVAAIQRKIGRETELNLENVLAELSKAVFRDVRDLVDEKGRPITNLNDIPDRIASTIDSVKETQSYDKEGNETRRTMEYKLVPKAAAIDMALKVTGGYAPEKHETSVSFNWDEHLEPPEDADSVEKEIEAEYELLSQSALPLSDRGDDHDEQPGEEPEESEEDEPDDDEDEYTEL